MPDICLSCASSAMPPSSSRKSSSRCQCENDVRDRKSELGAEMKLDSGGVPSYFRSMTAAQIIDEIKRLSPEEQAAAVRMVYELDAERKLSGPELSALAERLVNSRDPVEASRLREAIVRGFYGAKNDA